MGATHAVSTRERGNDDSDSVRYGQVNAMLLNEFLKDAVQELKNKLQQCTAGPKGSARRCAELRRFAAEISQTVETTVKIIFVRARVEWSDPSSDHRRQSQQSRLQLVLRLSD
jgi:hypothetical protein